MKKNLPLFRFHLPAIVHSIRFRLVIWFTLILTLTLVVFSAIVYYNQYRDFRNDAFEELTRKLLSLERILQNATRNGNQEISIPTTFFEEHESVALLTSSGAIAASQGPDISPAELASASTQVLTSRDRRVATWIDSSGSVLYLVSPLEGSSNLIILAAPLDPYGFLSRFQLTLLAGSALTIFLALLGGFWLADRAMRPVRAITQSAHTISESDLSRRLEIHTRDELGELAETFNQMLSRLEAAFQRQRQFVSDASHELRTPLTIINLETSRALAAQRSPAEYEQVLNVIRAENTSMTRMVNDLLTLARMDAGQAILKKEPLDLSDVALEAVERLEALAERSGVQLSSGNLPKVTFEGDRHYLLQLISNLVENAIKYSTGDEKRVEVETGLGENNAAWVRVSDNGVGIAPEHLAHLFERFYRVDEARTRADEPKNPAPDGSGLGLAIAQWIVQAHGGELRVESTLGRGTIFEAHFKG